MVVDYPLSRQPTLSHPRPVGHHPQRFVAAAALELSAASRLSSLDPAISAIITCESAVYTTMHLLGQYLLLVRSCASMQLVITSSRIHYIGRFLNLMISNQSSNKNLTKVSCYVVNPVHTYCTYPQCWRHHGSGCYVDTSSWKSSKSSHSSLSSLGSQQNYISKQERKYQSNIHIQPLRRPGRLWQYKRNHFRVFI